MSTKMKTFVFLLAISAALAAPVVKYDIPNVFIAPDFSGPVPACWKAEYIIHLQFTIGDDARLYLPTYRDHFYGYRIYYQRDRNSEIRTAYQMYQQWNKWFVAYDRHTPLADMNTNFFQFQDGVPELAAGYGFFNIKNIQKSHEGMYLQVAMGFFTNYKHVCYVIKVN